MNNQERMESIKHKIENAEDVLKLSYLDITDEELSDLIPIIETNKSLRIIFLTGNNLTIIPFFNLPNLLTVHTSFNPVTEFHGIIK